MKAFTEFQFYYYSQIWMFYSRAMNSKIDHIHEGVLRLVYSNHVSTFDKLLKKIDYLLFTTETFEV